MLNRVLPSSIRNSILAGSFLLGIASCTRGPLHQLEENKYNLIERVDEYTKSEFNNNSTEELELFKIDTIDISENDFEDFAKLNSKMKSLAESNNPQILTKDEWEYGYAIGPRQTLSGVKTKPGIDYHHVEEYEDKYIESSITIKAQNKVFANENETKFYIPVEYYGKPDTTVVEVKP